MSYLKTALNTAKTAIPAVGIPASMLAALLKGGANTASNLSQGGNISGLTYNSPTYKPEYGSTVATQETPLPQSAPQAYVPPAPDSTQPAPTSNFNGSSQYSDEDIVNLFNEMSGSLNKGNVYNQQLGGSAIDQLSRLQAQKANEKAGRTGLYEIDPNMAFSPDQIRQQRGAADAFYDEQLGKYAGMAQKESTASGKTQFGDLTSTQASMLNNIITRYEKSPLIQAVDRTPILSKSIESIYTNPSDAALQMNLSYAYIQALDTYQSAVREGELSNLNTIDSRIGDIQKEISKITGGQIVRPETAIKIADAAKELVTTIKTAAKNKSQSYRSNAAVFGLQDAWDAYTGGFTPEYDRVITVETPSGVANVNPNDPISWDSLNY
jgi:hypothetical protein